jgi:hypothetical protein
LKLGAGHAVAKSNIDFDYEEWLPPNEGGELRSRAKGLDIRNTSACSRSSDLRCSSRQ